MSHWDAIEEKTKSIVTADLLEATAYRLVSEQVLYAADIKSRTSYSLVEQYERDFSHVLAPLGVKVVVNRRLRFACGIPRHAKSSQATTEQTLMALVLLNIYYESARAGRLNDDGEVICDLVELGEKHRVSTNRQMSLGGKLEDLMRTMKRWGIARTMADENYEPQDQEERDQPFVVAIRPGIVDVLSETALLRLAQFAEAAPPTGEAEEGTETNDSGENVV
ncbi:MAG: DUF4194 domain-containing protein [Proteobacteria bacterium]|nr:DUF4194 domain-containing protein [Pseudomonadota bacterium]